MLYSWINVPEDQRGAFISPLPLILNAVRPESDPTANKLSEPIIVALIATKAPTTTTDQSKHIGSKISELGSNQHSDSTSADTAGHISLPDLTQAQAKNGEEGSSNGCTGTKSSSIPEIVDMGEEVKVYQSYLQLPIIFTGHGFSRKGMTIELDPPMIETTEYVLTVQSASKAVLKLSQKVPQVQRVGGDDIKPARKWRPNAGYLSIKSIQLPVESSTISTISSSSTVPNQKHFVGGSKGVRIAKVLPDPHIDYSSQTVSESAKIIEISGRGFTSIADVKVMLSPTMPEAYRIISVEPTLLRVELHQGQSWKPAYIQLKNYDGSATRHVPLQVLSIDTGAGNIVFPQAVTIGHIVPDDTSFAPTIGSQRGSTDPVFNTMMEITGEGFSNKKKATFDIRNLKYDAIEGADYRITTERDDKIVIQLAAHKHQRWEVRPVPAVTSPTSSFSIAMLISQGVLLTLLVITLLIMGYIFYGKYYRGIPLSMAPITLRDIYSTYKHEISEHLA